ncbi:MAG: lysophospholipid acyltransferase family protein [Vicinamibacteria bacterium]
MIRALLVSAFLVAYVPPACLVGWSLAWWQGSDRPLYQIGRLGVRLALLLAGVRVEVTGAEHLRDSANTVVMPNHLSNLDAPVLFTVLPPDFKVVAKKELFRIPFLASTFRMARFIELDRRDRDAARRALQKSAESLRGGASFLVFPEGTRSKSGLLGEFKKGGFLVALEAGSRIVPVAVAGTRELMPKGGFRIQSGVVRVAVLPPVDARAYRVDSRDALVAEVRGRIAQALQ